MERKHPRSARRDGQALIIIAIAVGILLFAVLWVADVHHIFQTKNKTQNAGDAAALSAARWQASTLNFQGELNLMHAMALAAGDFNAASVITQTQARLAFTGPMTAVAAAQQGAKLNGMPVNEEYTAYIRERAGVVRRMYAAQQGGMPEPYPNAWREYSAMLDAIADDGVAAGIDNAWFFNDPMGNHLLLQIEFYNAIAARDWCFFYRIDRGDILDDYYGFRWWPALPAPDPASFSQSELFGVWTQPGAASYEFILGNYPVQAAADRLAIDLNISNPDVLTHVGFWQFYNFGRWPDWAVMKDPSFPIDGKLREEYDYLGADTVTRVEAPTDRLSGNTRPRRRRADPNFDSPSDRIVWTGAAKPFGFLENDAGSKSAPHTSHLVLPAFREVRLIPIDASTAPSGGSFNLDWRRHCELHLPRYMQTGTGMGGCRYCANLTTWENPLFRQTGSGWLSTNSWRCTIAPPGGAPGGGTSHAH